MSRYILHTEAGQIVGHTSSNLPIDQVDGNGYLLMDCPDGILVSPESHFISDGNVVEYPPRPSDYVQFDFATGQWVLDDVAAFLALRNERDRLLAASDWTQVPDAPVDQAAWAEYRQALRDLPANTTDPRNPNWPTTP
jgi:hypothetical protein